MKLKHDIAENGRCRCCGGMRTPTLTENDRLIELEELRKFQRRIEWLGDPANKFEYSIIPDGCVRVKDRHGRDKIYGNLAAAIDDRMANPLTPGA